MRKKLREIFDALFEGNPEMEIRSARFSGHGYIIPTVQLYDGQKNPVGRTLREYGCIFKNFGSLFPLEIHTVHKERYHPIEFLYLRLVRPLRARIKNESYRKAMEIVYSLSDEMREETKERFMEKQPAASDTDMKLIDWYFDDMADRIREMEKQLAARA